MVRIRKKETCCCQQPLVDCYLKQNDVKDVHAVLPTGLLVDCSTPLAILSYVKCSIWSRVQEYISHGYCKFWVTLWSNTAWNFGRHERAFRPRHPYGRKAL